MPRHISILFPGQGSQSLGMLNHHSTDLLKSYEEEVNNLLGFNIIDVITVSYTHLTLPTTVRV